MSWIVAGLIVGVVAWVLDFILWTKVFTKGMEAFGTRPAEGQPAGMGPKVVGALALALVFGVFFTGVYVHVRASLWATGVPGGMEFGSILWLPVAFLTLGLSAWYDKVRPLLTACFWAWFIRLNVVGIAAALLVK